MGVFSKSLLEAMLDLEKNLGERRLQRSHLLLAITRLILHLCDILRENDAVTIEGRRYQVMRVKGPNGFVAVLTVDNGRGPALLGNKIPNTLPVASHDEQAFFAEHAKEIIDAFAVLVKSDTQRMENAEQNALDEAQHAERIT
jgi:hypothetical protein